MSGYRKGEPIYDGIAEVWFDDPGAMRALAGTAAYAAVQAEAKFIDHGTMGLIVAEDHVIKEGPPPPGGVKNVEFVTHAPGMPIEAFQHYWREVHGPLAALIPMVRRYVQSHTRLSAYETEGDMSAIRPRSPRPWARHRDIPRLRRWPRTPQAQLHTPRHSQ